MQHKSDNYISLAVGTFLCREIVFECALGCLWSVVQRKEFELKAGVKIVTSHRVSISNPKPYVEVRRPSTSLLWAEPRKAVRSADDN